MKVIDPGHYYHLETYDKSLDLEELIFMKRIGNKYQGNTGSPHGGTNCQEILRVLINRLQYLNQQMSCEENKICIGNARHMILLLEIRAKRVKGKHLPVPLDIDIEKYPTCKTCGHILCDEGHVH